MAKKKAKRKTRARRAARTTANPPQAEYVRDVDVLGSDATTAAERRTVRDNALANAWLTADIDTLERIDQAGWHGWAMWPRA